MFVAYIVNIHGTHSYWKQGALGAACQTCMGWSWAAACGAYRGGGISWRPPAYSLFYMYLRGAPMMMTVVIYCQKQLLLVVVVLGVSAHILRLDKGTA